MTSGGRNRRVYLTYRATREARMVPPENGVLGVYRSGHDADFVETGVSFAAENQDSSLRQVIVPPVHEHRVYEVSVSRGQLVTGRTVLLHEFGSSLEEHGPNGRLEKFHRSGVHHAPPE